MISLALTNQCKRVTGNSARNYAALLLLNALLMACNPDAMPTHTSLPLSPYTFSATVTLTPTSTPMPPSTQTPTTTATSIPTRTSVPTRTASFTCTGTPIENDRVVTCPGAPEISLKIDDWAIVSLDPSIPNNVRSQPNRSGEVIGQIQPGENVLVLDGPRCTDGYTWWFIHSVTGIEGWTAEGDATGYWLIPIQPLSAEWVSSQNVITLTSEQVRSAVDIEIAIKRVTAEDTRPGTVILDGRNGAFVFSGDDRSINLFVSNLTLRGMNQALIEKCDDGLFFDNFPLKNILIEDIEFICRAHGVVAGGAFDNVILRNNTFRTKISGIDLGGASSKWFITDNLIETDGIGIDITMARQVEITNNQIFVDTGIVLHNCSQFLVSDKIIHASHQGILLNQGSWNNQVHTNEILGVSNSGIGLESGVKDNFILKNRITCAQGANCLTIDATPKVLEMNTIVENRP